MSVDIKIQPEKGCHQILLPETQSVKVGKPFEGRMVSWFHNSSERRYFLAGALCGVGGCLMLSSVVAIVANLVSVMRLVARG